MGRQTPVKIPPSRILQNAGGKKRAGCGTRTLLAYLYGFLIVRRSNIHGDIKILILWKKLVVSKYSYWNTSMYVRITSNDCSFECPIICMDTKFMMQFCSLRPGQCLVQQDHWLTERPYLAIMAGNDLLSRRNDYGLSKIVSTSNFFSRLFKIPKKFLMDNYCKSLVRIFWPPKNFKCFLNFIQGDIVGWAGDDLSQLSFSR